MFDAGCPTRARPNGRSRQIQGYVTRFFVMLVVWLAVSGPLQAQNTQDLSVAAQAWINAERTKAGLRALEPSQALSRAAAAHASDLAQAGQFSHSGSDGSSVGQRVRRQGYGFCFVAENIAKGQGSLDEVLRGWMASEGHRRNMLAKPARDFGLVRGPGHLWVMVLGQSGC